MKVLDFLGAIVKGPVTVAADVYKRRLEIKSQEHIRELEIREAIHAKRLDAIRAGEQLDADWELAQIKNSGWKDEYAMLVIYAPFIACFCPWLAPHVLEGFRILSLTPVWYQGTFVTLTLAVFGIRRWRRTQSATKEVK